MAAAKIKLWLLLEAKIEFCAGLRTLIMPKATEGQMFTVTHQYKKANLMQSLAECKAHVCCSCLALFSLEAELRCSNQPMRPHSTYNRILFTIKFART